MRPDGVARCSVIPNTMCRLCLSVVTGKQCGGVVSSGAAPALLGLGSRSLSRLTNRWPRTSWLPALCCHQPKQVMVVQWRRTSPLNLSNIQSSKPPTELRANLPVHTEQEVVAPEQRLAAQERSLAGAI